MSAPIVMTNPNVVIVISGTRDGDKYIYRMTKHELLSKLKERHWGEDVKFADAGTVPELDGFVGLIVIKGDVVAPRPIDVVKEWDL